MSYFNIEKLLESGIQFPLKDWLLYQVTGADFVKFLQGQLTNDIVSQPQETAWKYARIDRSGRLQGMLYLIKEQQRCWALVPPYCAGVVDNIQKYIISEDVEFKKTSKYIAFSFGTNVDLHNVHTFPGVHLGIPGYFIFSQSPLPAINEEMHALMSFYSGDTTTQYQISHNAIINESLLLDEAVSFNKGCYLGQETVNKIQNNKKAGFFPMLISGSFDREEANKNYKIIDTLDINGTKYASALVAREHRVPGLEVAGAKISLLPPDIAPFDQALLVDQGLRLISNYFQNSQTEIALGIVDKLFLSFPQNINLLEIKCAILMKVGRNLEALKYLDKIHEIDSKNTMAHTNKSIIFMQLGDKEKAEQEKALAAQSTMLDSENMTLNSDHDDARYKLFQEVLEIDALDQMANAGVAEILMRRGLYSKSIHFFENALTSNKCSLKTILSYAETSRKLGQSDKARQILEKGLEFLKQRGDMKGAAEVLAKLR